MSSPMGCSALIHASLRDPNSSQKVSNLKDLGGGLSVTQNRTAWPISGGAIALQPGWFAGHADNLMYINLGLGSQPENYTVMKPLFEIIGPSDQPYPGTICLPQVTLPSGITPKSGDEATIQVIQTLKHGASLYSVSCTES